MSVDMNTFVNNAATGAYRLTASATKKNAPAETTAAAKEPASTSFGEAAVFEKSSNEGVSADGAVYEKSSADAATAATMADTTKTNTDNANSKVSDKEAERSALISQLKADQEARQNQLLEIVRKTMGGQGNALAKADDMWKFLASGDFEVDEETRLQAQKDIAEDGYWGVNQTSDRILDFAKALAGDDPEKADKMLEAFKKGYEQATKAWGKDLPDLTKQTYDSVLKKFDDWKNSGKKTEETQDNTKTDENAKTAGASGVTVSKNPNYNAASNQNSTVASTDATTA